MRLVIFLFLCILKHKVVKSMSFRADLMDFFESENTNYEFEYNVELGMRCKYLTYIERTGKPSTNATYHTFLCSQIETELRRGSERYGELEQEWSLLKYYYEKEATRVKKQQPYDPFRLWVLLDFIFKLKE